MAPLYNVNQIGVIKFSYSLKKSIKFYSDIKSLFIRIGFIVFVFSFIAAYVYSSRISKSIIKIKKDTLDIKNGIYNRVIPMRRNDELGELSEDIYYMSSKIEKNIEKMEDEQKKLNLAVKKLRALERSMVPEFM